MSLTVPVGAPYQRLEHAGGVVSLVTAAVSAPGEGHAKIVVAPKVVGVCRSDLRELRDDRYLRRDFGHEIVAEVVGRTHWSLPAVGTWTVYDPHPQVVRTSGFGNLVEIEGALESVRSSVVPIPSSMNRMQAAFAEPLACASHCLGRLAEVTSNASLDPTSPVAVVGAGMAGALIAASLHAANIPVVLLNRTRIRLDFLQERQFLPDSAFAHTYDRAPRMFSRVILATAALDAFQLQRSSELITPGGLLMLFSGTRPTDVFKGITLDPLRRGEHQRQVGLGDDRVVLAGTHGATRADFDESLRLLATGEVGGWRLGEAVARLVTTHLSLEEARSALPDQTVTGFVGKCVVTM